jgi:spore maturation protein CgeB
MVAQCRYYLAHDEERERIRRAGHERARRDHTWERRFEGLFAELARRGVLRR